MTKFRTALGTALVAVLALVFLPLASAGAGVGGNGNGANCVDDPETDEDECEQDYGFGDEDDGVDSPTNTNGAWGGCLEIDGIEGLWDHAMKFDNNGLGFNGLWDATNGLFTVTISGTGAAGTESNPSTMTFATSDDIVVYGVYVKAGKDNHNAVPFVDGVQEGTVTTGGAQQAISHVVFCYAYTDDGPTTGDLEVDKFYDANANGEWDEGEIAIAGWSVTVDGEAHSTPVAISEFEPGEYDVAEATPTESNWMAITATSQTATVTAGQTTSVAFGNLCLGAGNGHTIGFWSNKNGQALIDSDDLEALRALNLVTANGQAFDPTTNSAVRNFVLKASATNMAHMLSAQLAAMTLNARNLGATGLIYAPGTDSANEAGFASVEDVMAEADAALGANGLTVASGPDRDAQTALKNALDAGNNNLNWVQAEACAATFPVDESDGGGEIDG